MVAVGWRAMLAARNWVVRTRAQRLSNGPSGAVVNYRCFAGSCWREARRVTVSSCSGWSSAARLSLCVFMRSSSWAWLIFARVLAGGRHTFRSTAACAPEALTLEPPPAGDRFGPDLYSPSLKESHRLPSRARVPGVLPRLDLGAPTSPSIASPTSLARPRAELS